MAKKQQNQKKKTRKDKSSFVSQKPKVSVKQKKKTAELEINKKKAEEFAVKISQTQNDVRTFLEKFKADVARKKEKYQQYAQESQKKKTP